MLPIVPTEENLSNGLDFDSMVMMTHLERLEASLKRIEAAILDMKQQSHASNQTLSYRCSLRRSCRRFRSASAESMRRLRGVIHGWFGDLPLWGAYYVSLFTASCFRFAASCFAACAVDFANDPAHREKIMAQALEARRMAEDEEEIARYIPECLKNGTW